MWLLIAFFFEHNILKASIGWQLQRLTDSKETKPKCCSRNTLFGEAGQRLPQLFTLLRQRRSSFLLALTRPSNFWTNDGTIVSFDLKGMFWHPHSSFVSMMLSTFVGMQNSVVSFQLLLFRPSKVWRSDGKNVSFGLHWRVFWQPHFWFLQNILSLVLYVL